MCKICKQIKAKLPTMTDQDRRQALAEIADKMEQGNADHFDSILDELSETVMPARDGFAEKQFEKRRRG